MNKLKQCWATIVSIFKDPLDYFHKIHEGAKASPVLFVLAVVFVVEPVVSFIVDVIEDIGEVKQTLNPNLRPVTEGEFALMNNKIDYLEHIVENNMKVINENAAAKPIIRKSNKPLLPAPKIADVDNRTKAIDGYQELQQQLSTKQKQLNEQYIKNKGVIVKK